MKRGEPGLTSWVGRPKSQTSASSPPQGFFPDAMVSGYESLIASCENHPKDRHVLALAIHSRTETIVTFNVKDFKLDALEPWGIVAEQPADYLKVLFDHDQAAVTNALHGMA